MSIGTSPAAGTRQPARQAGQRSRAAGLLDLVIRFGVLAVLVGLVIYFSADIAAFRTTGNAISILRTASVAAICALGVTITQVVGGFDLSIGAIAGLAVTVSAISMVEFRLVGGIAVLLAILAGVVVGAVNGLLVVKFRIPDLLATLGTMFAIMGLKRWLVQGQTLTPGMTFNGRVVTGQFTRGFLRIDGGGIGPVTYSVVVFVVLAVAMWLFLERSRFGRVMYAIGGNPEAARLAGARVERYRFAAYLVSGLLSGIAGVILASRLGQGDPAAGDSVLLDAVAMALIGFAVLGANKPNALGTVVGAIFVTVILQGLTMKGFSYYSQDLVKGVVLLAALALSFTVSRYKR